MLQDTPSQEQLFKKKEKKTYKVTPLNKVYNDYTKILYSWCSTINYELKQRASPAILNLGMFRLLFEHIQVRSCFY